jgi:hypothetical protein
MKTNKHRAHYRPTEAKYKGGAHEMYVTYDLEQKTRDGGSAIYPKVKRVYIAGDVKHWHAGQIRKKSGREVHGVRIEYEQSRSGYRRHGYHAERDATSYEVSPAKVEPTAQRFVHVVEIPEHARNIHFWSGEAGLPAKYQHALQSVE